jgi:Plasmid pRiA4b ORF-3-like protein
MRQAATVREEARSNLLIKLLAISTASRVGRRELGKRICQTEAMSPSNKQIRRDSLNEIATLRVELRDTVIWRQAEASTSVTLKVLHDIVQAVMGWLDCHLWEFTIGKQRYGLSMDEDWGTEPRIEAGKVGLRDLLKPRKTVIDYLYDFGDCWEHRITITIVRQGEPGVSYPRDIGGEWNAPPEDCGGIPGFYAMLQVADPNNPDHADAKDWLDGYNPEVVDEVPIKYALSRIANRRKAAKARLPKIKETSLAA